ncbi:hypothetical protein BKA69DRAFT_1034605 [Paraphysoderma sedebokerense]|nr:hypothetical protein BKA69DRAFT_1034605 [Paraphysoderma sedebokerense]
MSFNRQLQSAWGSSEEQPPRPSFETQPPSYDTVGLDTIPLGNNDEKTSPTSPTYPASPTYPPSTSRSLPRSVGGTSSYAGSVNDSFARNSQMRGPVVKVQTKWCGIGMKVWSLLLTFIALALSVLHAVIAILIIFNPSVRDKFDNRGGTQTVASIQFLNGLFMGLSIFDAAISCWGLVMIMRNSLVNIGRFTVWKYLYTTLATILAGFFLFTDVARFWVTVPLILLSHSIGLCNVVPILTNLVAEIDYSDIRFASDKAGNARRNVVEWFSGLTL